MQNKLRKIRQYKKIVEEQIYKNKCQVKNIVTCSCGYKTDNTIPDVSTMTPFENGGDWGEGYDTHAWFRFTVTPETDNPYLIVETDKSGWDACNPQLILYINGKTVQGLDVNHREVPLKKGEKADVAIYAYTSFTVEKAKLFVSTAELSHDAFALYYDIAYPFDMLTYLSDESIEYAKIVDYLWRAVSKLDLYEVGSDDFYASCGEAHKFLEDEFYGKYCCPQKATTVGIGHTHIDCAWLWTLRQTREKVQRSFSTVLELMKRYPEYKFMSSQALLYKYLKEVEPELYAQVKERIKEGRWECEGAMWVEADCNLSSGESLIRQVLYGKNFFKEEFGVDNRVLWLPDVFGYTAALPQILKKCGVDWFVTQKISWNDTNRMPYDTFRWVGLDGTAINTHFITATDDEGGKSSNLCTYVGHTGAKMVNGTYKRMTQKNLSDEALLTFGHGDGGGGPTPGHLELARRAARGVPGSPNLKIEFAGDYLKRLEKNLESRTDVPCWNGELYLEFHRGTYTSIAKNKRNNRKSEFLFQDAELLGITADKLMNEPFPKAKLREGWEDILTNQFHDIIPGSSIKEVYDQSDIDYAKIKSIGDSIADGVRGRIAEKIDAKRGWVVFNPHSFNTEGLVQVNGKTVYTKEKISPKGYLATGAFVDTNTIKVDGKVIETPHLRVAFDDSWQIISIFDKRASREVLKSGTVGNEIRVYADYPDVYDAWEWQPHSCEEYKTVTECSSVEFIDDGVRLGIAIVRPFMKSTIKQTIWFYENVCRIDFDTKVDWHNKHQMLKTAFPVDVNTNSATFDVQFGSVQRPTHKNTSWDAARFEVCAHKYADISEGGYGVSIMNDCKYGHDIHDGVMQLSLLRAPTYPYPDADQGESVCTYSIMPHNCSFNECDVIKQAYYLNYPMVATPAKGEKDSLPAAFSAVTVNRENVICETVKQAEYGRDTIIRLYESANIRTDLEVILGVPAKEVYICDMMENETEKLEIKNGKVCLKVGGFEIITLKVKA